MQKNKKALHGDIIQLASDLISDFQKNVKASPEKMAELYQAFTEMFREFVKTRVLDLAKIIQDSELNKEDKLTFIFLLFHGLFGYEEYQLLLKKIDEKTAALKAERNALDEQIEDLENQQKVLTTFIYKNARKANEMFASNIAGIVSEGLKKIEGGKKQKELQEAEAIKQKLKQ